MCIYIKKLHTFHVVKLWESGKKIYANHLNTGYIYIYIYIDRCCGIYIYIYIYIDVVE